MPQNPPLNTKPSYSYHEPTPPQIQPGQNVTLCLIFSIEILLLLLNLGIQLNHRDIEQVLIEVSETEICHEEAFPGDDICRNGEVRDERKLAQCGDSNICRIWSLADS